jgi:hypothetical protein
MLQAWNTQTSADLSLNGPVGQVYALVVGNDMLFAAVQVILFASLFLWAMWFHFELYRQKQSFAFFWNSRTECLRHLIKGKNKIKKKKKKKPISQFHISCLPHSL